MVYILYFAYRRGRFIEIKFCAHGDQSLPCILQLLPHRDVPRILVARTALAPVHHQPVMLELNNLITVMVLHPQTRRWLRDAEQRVQKVVLHVIIVVRFHRWQCRPFLHQRPAIAPSIREPSQVKRPELDRLLKLDSKRHLHHRRLRVLGKQLVAVRRQHSQTRRAARAPVKGSIGLPSSVFYCDPRQDWDCCYTPSSCLVYRPTVHKMQHCLQLSLAVAQTRPLPLFCQPRSCARATLPS